MLWLVFWIRLAITMAIPTTTARVPIMFLFAMKPGSGGNQLPWSNLLHPEGPIKDLHNLNNNVADQDHGSSLNNIRPATGAHGNESAVQRRNFIFRQLFAAEAWRLRHRIACKGNSHVWNPPHSIHFLVETMKLRTSKHYLAFPFNNAVNESCQSPFWTISTYFFLQFGILHNKIRWNKFFRGF